MPKCKRPLKLQSNHFQTTCKTGSNLLQTAATPLPVCIKPNQSQTRFKLETNQILIGTKPEPDSLWSQTTFKQEPDQKICVHQHNFPTVCCLAARKYHQRK